MGFLYKAMFFFLMAPKLKVQANVFTNISFLKYIFKKKDFDFESLNSQGLYFSVTIIAKLVVSLGVLVQLVWSLVVLV